jgi:hypothetical protein
MALRCWKSWRIVTALIAQDRSKTVLCKKPTQHQWRVALDFPSQHQSEISNAAYDVPQHYMRISSSCP